MTRQTKLILALTTVVKKTGNKKVKQKIRSIKQKQSHYNWLAQ